MAPNIVIVDDDKLITKTLALTIKTLLNIEVISFNDPEEAAKCEVILNNKADIIISDFMMPKMNGYEFLKVARQYSKDAVLILLTGYADKENAIKFINEVGLYYYLEKPWDNTILLRILKNGLEKRDLTSELSAKLSELEVSNTEIQKLLGIVQDQYQREMNRSEQLEVEVGHRTKEIRDLLDNAGQGFLKFDQSLLVKKGYSSECKRIFGRDIAGMKIAHLIYPESDKEIQLLEYTFERILNDTDSSSFDFLHELLPVEVEIGIRTIKIEYKYVENQLMLVITDISDKKEMENKIVVEKSSLNMVVKVLTNTEDFINTLDDFKKFIDEEMINRKLSYEYKDEMKEIFRKVHTYKGTFGIFYLINTVDFLNNLETKISNIVNAPKEKCQEFLSELTRTYLLESLEKDMMLIEKATGNINLSSSKKIYEKDLVDKFFIGMKERLPSKYYSVFTKEFKKLEYIQFRELFKDLPEYAFNVAAKLGKEINFLKILGGEFLISQDKYKDLGKSIIHIINNTMAHGIECADDREELGKSREGNISVVIKQNDNFIGIRISDDGEGIDLEKIKSKAVEIGIYSQEDIEKKSTEELHELIFLDNFTTKESADQISGRGVGLSAVKSELQKIGGQILVSSNKGFGSEFKIFIPFSNEATQRSSNSSELIDKILKVASSKIYNESNETARVLNKIQEDKIYELSGYTIQFSLRGDLEGDVYFTLDNEECNALIKKFNFACEKNNFESKSASLLECMNIVIGRVSGMLNDENLYIEISYPIVRHSEASNKLLLPQESSYVLGDDGKVIFVTK